MASARNSQISQTILLLTIVLVLLVGKATFAIEQVDQSNLPAWAGGWTHVNPTAEGRAAMWQTFTPSRPNLTAVEINILTITPGRGDDTLTVEIAKDGDILATTECYVEDGFDGLLRFEFPQIVPLVPEEIYELMVRDTGTVRFGWKYASNTYERGSRYVNQQERPGTDWLFQTYSETEPAQTKYSGGTGEPNDPYQIATAEDLMLLGESPEDYDKHFIMTADIDLDPNLPGREVFDRAVIASDPTNSDPEAFDGNSFSGCFDGQGYVIRNLNIQGEDYISLFGSLNPEAKISNLGMEVVNISGRFNVGGLVGENYGSISSSYVTGEVNGNRTVGGLVGQNTYGCISLCYNTSKVKGEYDYTGGLVGANSGNISSSYSTGRVDGVYYVGGLTGANSGIIIASYSTGSLRAGNNVGGLVGDNERGSIMVSYSTVEILANDNVGGLVGSNSGSISSSYSTGIVHGASDVGGLVGISIFEKYDPVSRIHSSIGVVTNCFWDTQTSGQDTSAGGTGLTTAEMQNINTFLNEGWDFVNETNNGNCDFWLFQEGTYPTLAVFWGIVPIEPQGAGIPEEPYLITNAKELLSIWYRPMAHYRLTEDIDLSGITRNLAIVPWLNGSFDGNDFCIRSIQIKGFNHLGVFGIIGLNTEVKNLRLEDVSIEGSGYQIGGLAGLNLGSLSSSYSIGMVTGEEHTGGLVGDNGGNITLCHSAGEVSGNLYIGGFVGDNALYSINGTDVFVASGIITNCYSTCMISGDKYVGGLVGSHWGESITASYSTGMVNGNEKIGGLVGDNFGNINMSYSNSAVSGEVYVGGLIGYHWGFRSINMSYSTGMVNGNNNIGGLIGLNIYNENVSSSFWDTETSDQITSGGGIGKTTAQMQTASTFINAGWDFVDETANGTDDIWWIDEGVDYPRLWWEADDN